jgi:hypothetical protein
LFCSEVEIFNHGAYGFVWLGETNVASSVDGAGPPCAEPSCRLPDLPTTTSCLVVVTWPSTVFTHPHVSPRHAMMTVLSTAAAKGPTEVEGTENGRRHGRW